MEDEKNLEMYCPYENNINNKYCRKCKGGKIPFWLIGKQKSLKGKISRKYNCPDEFTFSEEMLIKYNKDKK
ncbi:MAG: hypothetical protein ABFQ65_02190 [Nanoarchaeota archaeon]